jgi:hypothetical protein
MRYLRVLEALFDQRVHQDVCEPPHRLAYHDRSRKERHCPREMPMHILGCDSKDDVRTTSCEEAAGNVNIMVWVNSNI